MSKIIETTESVRKTAINNLFEASEEFIKINRNYEKVRDRMNNTGIALHQIGINLETIQGEKDELIQALIITDEIICNLCKRLNPQHKNCTSCSDRDYRVELLENQTGKSIEELLK